MKLTRREALRHMLGGAALAVVPVGLVLPEEPERRIWQVGAQLQRSVLLSATTGVNYDPGVPFSLDQYYTDLASGESADLIAQRIMRAERNGISVEEQKRRDFGASAGATINTHVQAQEAAKLALGPGAWSAVAGTLLVTRYLHGIVARSVG